MIKSTDVIIPVAALGLTAGAAAQTASDGNCLPLDQRVAREALVTANARDAWNKTTFDKLKAKYQTSQGETDLTTNGKGSEHFSVGTFEFPVSADNPGTLVFNAQMARGNNPGQVFYAYREGGNIGERSSSQGIGYKVIPDGRLEARLLESGKEYQLLAFSVKGTLTPEESSKYTDVALYSMKYGKDVFWVAQFQNENGERRCLPLTASTEGGLFPYSTCSQGTETTKASFPQKNTPPSIMFNENVRWEANVGDGYRKMNVQLQDDEGPASALNLVVVGDGKFEVVPGPVDHKDGTYVRSFTLKSNGLFTPDEVGTSYILFQANDGELTADASHPFTVNNVLEAAKPEQAHYSGRILLTGGSAASSGNFSLAQSYLGVDGQLAGNNGPLNGLLVQAGANTTQGSQKGSTVYAQGIIPIINGKVRLAADVTGVAKSISEDEIPGATANLERSYLLGLYGQTEVSGGNVGLGYTQGKSTSTTDIGPASIEGKGPSQSIDVEIGRAHV
jgi:hypothetical protein